MSKEGIKTKLLNSRIIDEVFECEDLNKEAEEVQDPERAAEIIKRYEDIIKTKRRGIINIAYHQGQVFKKFKEKEKFAELVDEFTKMLLFLKLMFLNCVKNTLNY